MAMVALKDLAENGWIATLAYFFAFMPWGIIYAFDFIGDRWKSIRDTRKEGRLHIVLTLLPLSYVLFYAVLQFVAKDYKEMAAALAASVLSILHVFRTIWGLIQLSVFEDWTFRALKCMSDMGYGIKTRTDFIFMRPRPVDLIQWFFADRRVPSISDQTSIESVEVRFARQLLTCSEKSKFCSEKTLRETVKTRMIVNNSLVDNVFHGAELPVRFRNGHWQRLRCTKPEECLIRWSVAFLSQFGAPWLRQCNVQDVEIQSASDEEAVHEAKSCIRCYRNIAIFAFLHVTHQFEDQDRSLIDPGFYPRPWTKRTSTLVDNEVSESCFPYDCGPAKSNLFALKCFEHTITDAKNSWHALALRALNNREHAAVDGISAPQIASFLYILDKNPISSQAFVESLSTLRPSGLAGKSLLRQLALAKNVTFSELMNAVPVSKKYFYVPLWAHSSRHVNRLILQASVHIDNWLSLSTGDDIKVHNCLEYMKGYIENEVLGIVESASDDSVFETQKKFELTRIASLFRDRPLLRLPEKDGYFIDTPRFLGCIMETVRSEIAEWIFDNGESDDWELPLTQSVEFSISPQLEHILLAEISPSHNRRSISMRLLWEAQSGMQKALGRKSSTPPHATNEAAFLCILGFPSITLEEVSMEEESAVMGSSMDDESSTPQTSIPMASHYTPPQSSIDSAGSDYNGTTVKMYTITPMAAPQDISLQLDLVVGSVEKGVGLMRATSAEGRAGPVSFKWRRWRDAFLGRLSAHSEWRNYKGLESRDTGLARASEMSLREGRMRTTEKSIETDGNARIAVWEGWRPHNPGIAFFEVRKALISLKTRAISFEPDAETDAKTYFETDTEVDFKTDTEVDFETDFETDTGVDFETDTGIDFETDAVTDAETHTEPIAKVDVDAVTETGTEPDAGPDVGTDTEADIETHAEPDFNIVSEKGTETDIETHAKPDAVLGKAVNVVKAALSGEGKVAHPDHIWMEDCRSVIEIYETAIEELDRSNPSKALTGLRFCVQEFAHKASLEQMFKILLRNDTLDEAELDIMVCSMDRGAMLLANQRGRISTPYKRFSLTHVGNIFAHIYYKTGRIRALEYSMIGDRVGNPQVEALRLSCSDTRTNLLLAIYYQGNYLRTEVEAENERAIFHLSEWGKSLGLSHAYLSIGFLLEKGSFSGREAHKMYPLISLFQSEALVKATMLRRFRSRESLSGVFGSLWASEHPMSSGMVKRWLHCAKPNGLKPDPNSAIEVYAHLCEIAGADPAARNSIKSIALNRQGLIKIEADYAQALVLFEHAVFWGQVADENRNKFIAVNNVGVVLHAQLRDDCACREFEKVMNGCQGSEDGGSWETRAGGSIDRPRKFSSQPLSPATTSANNLSVAKELMSAEEEEEEVVRLYEEAVECGHPAAMYNYAVYLVTGPKKNEEKAEQLLEQVLAVGDELIPMYNLISSVLFLRKLRLYQIQSTGLALDEIDGCLVIVKMVQGWRYDSGSYTSDWESSPAISVSSIASCEPNGDENV